MGNRRSSPLQMSLIWASEEVPAGPGLWRCCFSYYFKQSWIHGRATCTFVQNPVLGRALHFV